MKPKYVPCSYIWNLFYANDCDFKDFSMIFIVCDAKCARVWRFNGASSIHSPSFLFLPPSIADAKRSAREEKSSGCVFAACQRRHSTLAFSHLVDARASFASSAFGPFERLFAVLRSVRSHAPFFPLLFDPLP